MMYKTLKKIKFIK